MPLTFAINGQIVNLSDAEIDPTVTLNDYIRRHTRFTGTKLACGEGGCGACAVSMARVDESGNVKHVSANSCLRPLAAMDGWSVTTTEGLGQESTGFHPVQERIAAMNGSQCGFCTPGMVMTTYTALKANPGLSVDEMELAFDSNLCRCTGFRPIAAAAQSLCQTNDIEDCIGACGGQAAELTPYDGASDPSFPDALRGVATAAAEFEGSGRRWIRCTTREEVFAARAGNPDSKLVAAHTSIGVFKTDTPPVFVDINNVAGLRDVNVDDAGLTVGAGCTFTELVALLRAQLEAAPAERTRTFQGLIDAIHRVAGFHIRNSGTIGGNVALARTHAFLSDFTPAAIAAGASVVVARAGGDAEMGLAEFVAAASPLGADEMLWAIKVPFSGANDRYAFHKAALRPQFSHALVNAGFRVALAADGTVESATIAFGGVAERIQRAESLEAFLVGKPMNQETLQGAIDLLKNDVTGAMTGDRLKYRQRLVTGFFYKFLLAQVPEGAAGAAVESAQQQNPRTGLHGSQSFATSDEHAPVSKPINKLSARRQASGEAQYTDDVQLVAGTRFATYAISTRAKATIVSIDTAAALASPGVERVLLAADIPNNDCSILPFGPEPVLADGEVISCGQPVAIVVADTMRHAEAGAALVDVTYGDASAPAVITIEDAVAAGAFIPGIENVYSRGDADANMDAADHRVQGGIAEDDRFVLKEQKHFYLEPQSAYAVPGTEGDIDVWSAMQWPGGVNTAVAKTLGVSLNQVNIRQRRAGGGFGGKLTAAAKHASASAAAATVMGVPIRLVLNRNLDMAMVGGRHTYKIDYDVAFTNEGKITALKIETIMDAGCTPDLSFFCCMAMARGTDQCYYVPHYNSHSRCVMTNTLTKTACRGPAEIQASIAIETIIERVAHELGVDPHVVREANLYPADNPELCVDPSGQPLTAYTIPQLWAQVMEQAGYNEKKAAAAAFNAANRWRKKGVSLTPVKYEVGGVSHSASVNIYVDGSVLVRHSGSEIGQGLFTKVAQVASYELGRLTGTSVDLALIRNADTQSHQQPNAPFTGGSTGSEGACEATRRACAILVERLRPVLEGLPEDGDRSWQAVLGASQAMGSEVNLQAAASFNKHDDGSAHSYHNWGVCVTDVELDVLTGEIVIQSSDIIYDCGKSLNPAIDIGQAEGAFFMGLGMCFWEDVIINDEGQLVTDGTWEYKLPSMVCAPREFNVQLMHNASFDRGILSSKASGEPPLVLATSALMALRQCIDAARSDAGITGFYHLGTPATVDVIQGLCGVDDAQFTV